MKYTVFIVLGLLCVGLRAAGGYKPVASFEAADYITPEQLKDYLSFISSDELEGRDTPSRGLNTAALFIATHLSRWGISPGAGDGSYFQKISLRRSKIDLTASRVSIGDEVFEYGKDFLARPVETRVSGRAVYVGHGHMVKGKNIDPFAGIDVEERIVIYSAELPKGVVRADVAGKKGEEWENAAGFALKNKAKALILVAGYQQLVAWERSYRSYVERGTMVAHRLEESTSTDEGPLPVITASARLVSTLFRGEIEGGSQIFGSSFTGDAPASFALSEDKVITIEIGVNQFDESTQNVVAILEGSDPTLKDEYIAIGSHYDHVGVGTVAAGDSIYNGADDDGSGTVSMMAIAEALSRGPKLKRSILFVWHAAEEKGLLGSKYFTQFPTVPLGSIVTQLNIDMIGRSKVATDRNPANKDLSEPDEVYVIGSNMMSSTLGSVTEGVNSSYLKMRFNYRYDDPKDPNRFFFRSDHYNYAQKGVPIVFWFDGVHEDYHKRTDSIDKIDFQKLAKVTRTVCATAIELATLAKRPAVDRELPEELKRRR